MSPGQTRQSFPITVSHLKLQVTPGDLKKKILLLIYEQITAVTWGLNLSFEFLTISLVTLYKIIN